MKEALKMEVGHAGIENNNILYIYGNAYEIVLKDVSLQLKIESV